MQTVAPPQTQVREFVDRFAAAIRAKDVDAVLALYAPGIVSFDLGAFQYVGTGPYRQPWEETFASFDGPIEYEVRDLEITASDELAFSHSFNRMAGQTVDGGRTDLWVRWTAGFERVADGWLITHEQVSVPVDLETGRAVLDLAPANSG